MFVAENGIAGLIEITEVRDLGTEVEVSDGLKMGRPGNPNPNGRSRLPGADPPWSGSKLRLIQISSAG